MKSIGLLSWVLALTILGSACVCAAGQKAALVDLDLKNVTVEQGISALFAGTGYKYMVEPGVSGKVIELKLKGITFEQALTLFTNAAGLTYTISDGMYIFSPVANPGQATRTIIQQGTAKYAQKPVPSASVKYPQAQVSEPASPQTAPQAAMPSQQVIVNQQAPVIYSQPGYNPGYSGYPPTYGAGNFGFGGYWPLVAFGGFPYVTRFGLGPVPPPGWVSPDSLRFLRNLNAILPGVHIYGPGY
ncbi:MAG: STN domain-containing protein [Armatimonadota bacterium]